MINAISEAMNNKTIDQYKIIEAKYEILRRFITKANTLEEVQMLVASLDEPAVPYFISEEILPTEPVNDYEEED